jgi:hypothetical protein
MRTVTALALLSALATAALATAALAKPAPVDRATGALARVDLDINVGPAGATLERNYFEAPQPPFSAGGFPCRLQPSLLDKTSLAEACRGR